MRIMLTSIFLMLALVTVALGQPQAKMPKFITEDVSLEVGDRITTLQGSEVTSCEAMMAAYSDIAVGESVKLTIDRDGGSLTLAYTKPQTPGIVKMQQKK